MSRGGNIETISNNLTWEEIFNKSQGFYFQYIVTKLGKKNKILSEENASELLKEIRKEKENLISKKKLKGDKPLPKIEVEEMPFTIPINWAWCRLPDLLAFANDAMRRGPFGSSITKDMFIPQSDNATKVYEQKNAIYKNFRLGHYYIDIEKHPNLKSFLAGSGDILISCAGTIGETYLLPEQAPQGVINQALLKIRLNCEVIENNYFIKFFQSSLKSQVNEDAKGSAMKNLSSIKYLKENLLVPLPPRTEQKMILNFLQDLAKNALEENKEYFDLELEKAIVSIHQGQIHHAEITSEISSQLELVSKLRQAFLREAMQGKIVLQDTADESADVLLEKIKAEKVKLIAENQIKKQKPLLEIKPEEIPFEIPTNWTWCRLGEIANNVEYGTSQKADLNSANVPVLRMNNIFEGNVILEDLKYVKSTIKDLPRLYLQNGDLLFNRTNSYELVGKSGVFKGENETMTFASYLIRIQFGDLVSEDFVNYYINSVQCRETQIEPDIIQQNGQANFNGTKLQNIITPLPPLAEQKRIVEKLKSLMRFCDELEQNIKDGQKQTESLLQVSLMESLQS